MLIHPALGDNDLRRLTVIPFSVVYWCPRAIWRAMCQINKTKQNNQAITLARAIYNHLLRRQLPTDIACLCFTGSHAPPQILEATSSMKAVTPREYNQMVVLYFLLCSPFAPYQTPTLSLLVPELVASTRWVTPHTDALHTLDIGHCHLDDGANTIQCSSATPPTSSRRNTHIHVINVLGVSYYVVFLRLEGN